VRLRAAKRKLTDFLTGAVHDALLELHSLYKSILIVLRMNRNILHRSPTYFVQISPWLRSILLLVSVGACDVRAVSVAFGGRDVQIQLHW